MEVKNIVPGVLRLIYNILHQLYESAAIIAAIINEHNSESSSRPFCSGLAALYLKVRPGLKASC